MAIKLDDHDKIREVFTECPDDLIKKQLDKAGMGSQLLILI